MKKKTKTEQPKQKKADPVHKSAEGKLESVGVMNNACYVIIDGRKVTCGDNEIMKVEVRKK